MADYFDDGDEEELEEDEEDDDDDEEEEEARWVTGHAWEQAEAEVRGKRQQGNVVASSSSRCFSALRKLLNTQVSADTT